MRKYLTGFLLLFLPVFIYGQYTVTLDSIPSAGGRVSGGGTYDAGTNVTVTATPNSGYAFVNWTDGDGTEVSSLPDFSFEIFSDTTLIAHFVKTFIVSTSMVPDNSGIISGEGSYDSLAIVNMTATPNSGYAFVNWTDGNGTEVSSLPDFSFEISSDTTLIARFVKLQTLNLTAGWNIMSFNVLPDNPDMFTILTPLIDSGYLQKVQDEAGNAIEYVTNIGWVNKIGDMAPTEGYKIRVNNTTHLTVSGTEVQLPYNIPLSPGWNIMGFPADEPQLSQDVLQELADTNILTKVQDQTGSSVEYVDPIGWVYNITSFLPGQGYKIYVKADTSLTISGSSNKSAIIFLKKPQFYHFSPVWKGNGYNHMNIYILDTEGLDDGDEIGIFDNELCVGTGIMETGKDYISIIASMDDPVTKEKDGFINGDDIMMRVWKKNQNTEYKIGTIKFPNNYSNKFYESETSVIQLNPEMNIAYSKSAWKLDDAYPNPFNEQVFISYSLPKETKVRIEVYNLTGEIIRVLTDEIQPQGNHVVSWNGTDHKGNPVASGVYFYRMITPDFVKVKKLLFVKD